MILVKEMTYFDVYLVESDDFDDNLFALQLHTNYVLWNKEYDTIDFQDASEVRVRSNGQLFDAEKGRLIQLEKDAEEYANVNNVVH